MPIKSKFTAKILKNKAKEGVLVRFTYNCIVSKKFIKELKKEGVKIYRFCKYNTIDKQYSNLRNIISIDGKMTYIGKFLNGKLLNEKY